MAEVNKFGLSRNIPDPIKREVRQRCGFGCVVCGAAIYQYEHVEPLFSDAETHDPNCIALLCGSCHDRATRGILSKETIKLQAKNPKCLEQGFSFGPFDLGQTPPEIIFGTLKAKNIGTLIKIYGDEILSIVPPEQEGSPFLINAFLNDRNGNLIFGIKNNEWITPADNWDVEVIGQRITIRMKLGDILLCLRSDPPHRLIIERLEMLHKGVKICCEENQTIEVTTPSGQHFKSSQMEIEGARIGVEVTDAGMGIGVGGGSVYIGEATFGNNPSNFHRAPLPPFNMNTFGKIGRNEKCPCGSGEKYKRCCGVIR
jgi:hypothetical protein